ncbi:MAG: glycoside hydrolase family 75 protein, partial [Chthoniobacterales bacterium]
VIGCCSLMVLTSCEKPAPAPQPSTPTPIPTATPKPPPTPTPIPTIDRKRMSVSELFNDMEVVSKLDAVRSDETASLDRTQPGSYRLELTVHADVPTPGITLAQIKRNDSTLPAALPGLEALLAGARVSPSFEQLYALKLDNIKSHLARIDTLLDRHNFYDCETILEMRNPATGRCALFLQGDMDVNTDGSDGDRNFDIEPGSIFFQPQTSYRWKRLTDRPNQFLESTRAAIAKAKADAAAPDTTAARKRELSDVIAQKQATLIEIGRYSFLIAGNDPYIVLPSFMLRSAKGPFAPAIGDYAAVVHNGVAYPAIVGDAGPAFKFGEAAIRLCKQLNPKSSANNRPVSSLKVTYIVFPGSKDAAPGPPDLAKWGARCTELFTDLGVKPAKIHAWENLIKPWPTPTPTPTPTPVPTPTPTPTPSPTVTPVPSPSPAT